MHVAGDGHIGVELFWRRWWRLTKLLKSQHNVNWWSIRVAGTESFGWLAAGITKQPSDWFVLEGSVNPAGWCMTGANRQWRLKRA